MAASGEHTETKSLALNDKLVLPQWRDGCMALLLPLNTCRRENAYLPWKCEHERHNYESCQFLDYIRRMEEKKIQKAKALEAAAEEE